MLRLPEDNSPAGEAGSAVLPVVWGENGGSEAMKKIIKHAAFWGVLAVLLCNGIGLAGIAWANSDGSHGLPWVISLSIAAVVCALRCQKLDRRERDS